MRPDPNPTSQHGHVRWLFCLGKKDTCGLLAVNAGLVPRLHSLLRGPPVSHMLTLN